MSSSGASNQTIHEGVSGEGGGAASGPGGQVPLYSVRFLGNADRFAGRFVVNQRAYSRRAVPEPLITMDRAAMITATILGGLQ